MQDAERRVVGDSIEYRAAEGRIVEGADGTTGWPYRGTVVGCYVLDADGPLVFTVNTGSGNEITVEGDTINAVYGTGPHNRPIVWTRY